MTEKRFTDIWCSETGHIGVTDYGIDKEFTSIEFEDFLNELNDENKKLRQEKKRWIEKTDKLEQYIDSLFFGNTHICKHLDVEMAKFWCDKEQKYHLPQCKYKDCFKKENLVKTADEVLRSVE